VVGLGLDGLRHDLDLSDVRVPGVVAIEADDVRELRLRARNQS
jgi:hypothetical protein